MNFELLRLLDEVFRNCVRRNERHFIQVADRITNMCNGGYNSCRLTFAVSMVSQFMSRASPPHWVAIKRIMRYFKGTLD